MAKLSNISPESTIYIKNIDNTLTRLEIEQFFSQFGEITTLIFKNKQQTLPSYAIVQYKTNEQAINSLEKINSFKIGNSNPIASMFQGKPHNFQPRTEFYNLIQKKIDLIVGIAKKKIAEKNPIVKIQPNFKCEQGENPVPDIPILQVFELLQQKIAERDPDLLGKARRHLKKVETGMLASILHEESSFISFINFLRSQG